jgi:hypothetical protein
LVYSCQSACARIDFIARKRSTEAYQNSNDQNSSAEAPLSEKVRGKRPLREGGVRSIETKDSTVHFIGKVVITPKLGGAQLIFNVSQKTNLLDNTFHAPRISFRLTIPRSSEIFKIAAFGTVFQLREMLESHIEFWNVCDEDGVSLIHVSILKGLA